MLTSLCPLQTLHTQSTFWLPPLSAALSITTPRAFKLYDLLREDCTGRDDQTAGLDVASRAIFKFPRRARLLQYRLSAELDVSLAAVVRRDDSEDIVKDENSSSVYVALAKKTTGAMHKPNAAKKKASLTDHLQFIFCTTRPPLAMEERRNKQHSQQPHKIRKTSEDAIKFLATDPSKHQKLHTLTTTPCSPNAAT